MILALILSTQFRPLHNANKTFHFTGIKSLHFYNSIHSHARLSVWTLWFRKL